MKHQSILFAVLTLLLTATVWPSPAVGQVSGYNGIQVGGYFTPLEPLQRAAMPRLIDSAAWNTTSCRLEGESCDGGAGICVVDQSYPAGGNYGLRCNLVDQSTTGGLETAATRVEAGRIEEVAAPDEPPLGTIKYDGFNTQESPAGTTVPRIECIVGQSCDDGEGNNGTYNDKCECVVSILVIGTTVEEEQPPAGYVEKHPVYEVGYEPAGYVNPPHYVADTPDPEKCTLKVTKYVANPQPGELAIFPVNISCTGGDRITLNMVHLGHEEITDLTCGSTCTVTEDTSSFVDALHHTKINASMITSEDGMAKTQEVVTLEKGKTVTVKIRNIYVGTIEVKKQAAGAGDRKFDFEQGCTFAYPPDPPFPEGLTADDFYIKVDNFDAAQQWCERDFKLGNGEVWSCPNLVAGAICTFTEKFVNPDDAAAYTTEITGPDGKVLAGDQKSIEMRVKPGQNQILFTNKAKPVPPPLPPVAETPPPAEPPPVTEPPSLPDDSYCCICYSNTDLVDCWIANEPHRRMRLADGQLCPEIDPSYSAEEGTWALAQEVTALRNDPSDNDKRQKVCGTLANYAEQRLAGERRPVEIVGIGSEEGSDTAERIDIDLPTLRDFLEIDPEGGSVTTADNDGFKAAIVSDGLKTADFMYRAAFATIAFHSEGGGCALAPGPAELPGPLSTLLVFTLGIILYGKIRRGFGMRKTFNKILFINGLTLLLAFYSTPVVALMNDASRDCAGWWDWEKSGGRCDIHDSAASSGYAPENGRMGQRDSGSWAGAGNTANQDPHRQSGTQEEQGRCFRSASDSNVIICESYSRDKIKCKDGKVYANDIETTATCDSQEMECFDSAEKRNTVVCGVYGEKQQDTIRCQGGKIFVGSTETTSICDQNSTNNNDAQTTVEQRGEDAFEECLKKTLEANDNPALREVADAACEASDKANQATAAMHERDVSCAEIDALSSDPNVTDDELADAINNHPECYTAERALSEAEKAYAEAAKKAEEAENNAEERQAKSDREESLQGHIGAWDAVIDSLSRGPWVAGTDTQAGGAGGNIPDNIHVAGGTIAGGFGLSGGGGRGRYPGIGKKGSADAEQSDTEGERSESASGVYTPDFGDTGGAVTTSPETGTPRGSRPGSYKRGDINRVAPATAGHVIYGPGRVEWETTGATDSDSETPGGSQTGPTQGGQAGEETPSSTGDGAGSSNCSSSNDCRAGEICSEGSCITPINEIACSQTIPCETGKTCMDGRCESLPNQLLKEGQTEPSDSAVTPVSMVTGGGCSLLADRQ